MQKARCHVVFDLDYTLVDIFPLWEHALILPLAELMGISAEIDDDDWRGRVSDTYSGYTLFATLYY